jgi:hypothetical protein
MNTIKCGPANNPHNAPISEVRRGDEVVATILPHESSPDVACANEWKRL